MQYQHVAELLGIGTPELLVILVIVLLLFGSKKLPELSRSLGTSMKELRKGMSSEVKDDTNKSSDTNSN
jgi:sec-independent protein translocase protein TatA